MGGKENPLTEPELMAKRPEPYETKTAAMQPAEAYLDAAGRNPWEQRVEYLKQRQRELGAVRRSLTRGERDELFRIVEELANVQ